MARKPTGQLIVRRRASDTRFGARVRAAGERHYVTIGRASEGMTESRAREELENLLADIRRGLWSPPASEPVVEVPQEEPTFHVFASEWVERRRHEVDERTVEHWTWGLSNHLLPFFKECRPPAITPALVERYKTSKLREREARLAELERWRAAERDERGPIPLRPLNNTSINKTLKLLAQLLDDAIELGYLDANPARGKRRRLKASRPRRTWLELDEVRSLLAAAGEHRALLATLILAGLRVSSAACAGGPSTSPAGP